MARKVNMEKLLAKIAKHTQTDVTELKAAAKESKDLYSHEERVFQKQAIINFFTNYIAPEKPVSRQGESKVAFSKRLAEYERKRAEWRIRTCKGCKLEFAYAYSYDGVAYCSLECLDEALRKIGLELTVGRDLKKRWGLHHPAIVPASAFETLRNLYGHDALMLDDPSQSENPTPPTVPQSVEQMSNTAPEQDNLSNTA